MLAAKLVCLSLVLGSCQPGVTPDSEQASKPPRSGPAAGSRLVHPGPDQHPSTVPRLGFEENLGQFRKRLHYVASGQETMVGLGAGAQLWWKHQRGGEVGIRVVGADKAATVERAEIQGEVNYLTGSKQAQWRTGAATFGRVSFDSVLPGVDAEFRTRSRSVEQIFHVGSGADPNQIALSFNGDKRPRLLPSGGLRLGTGAGGLNISPPRAYQVVNGRRKSVAVSFAPKTSRSVALRVGAMDPSLPVTIDPKIALVASISGPGDDFVRDVAVDARGRPVVVGHSDSNQLASADAWQRTRSGMSDVVVRKFSRDGRRILYTTYLGGRGRDYATALDVVGNAVFVTGWTFSNQFPTTRGSYKPELPEGDPGEGFVAKIVGGSRLGYSTLVGGTGNENPYGLAVNPQGRAVIVGYTTSRDYPVSSDAYQPVLNGATDIVITAIDSSGSSLSYSTYLGGEGFDEGTDVTIDRDSNVYVTGGTTSRLFPTLSALQPTPGGPQDGAFALDAFLLKFTPSWELAFSTYLGGGKDDYGRDVESSPSGVIVTGETSSSDFPVRNGFQEQLGGGEDAFITSFTSTGSEMLYSTLLGGSGEDTAYSAEADADGAVIVVGDSRSEDFPTRGAVHSRSQGGADVFAAGLSPAGDQLSFATYLGGGRADHAFGVAASGEDLWVGGITRSRRFEGRAHRRGTGWNAFILKLIR